MERRLRPGYNCAHFLCEAWQAETGQDISDALGCFLHDRATRTADPSVAHAMRRLPGPGPVSVVVWRRPGSAPHVGMWVRGLVLHLTDSGPVRQLLAVASLGYTSVRHYAPR